MWNITELHWHLAEDWMELGGLLGLLLALYSRQWGFGFFHWKESFVSSAEHLKLTWNIVKYHVRNHLFWKSFKARLGNNTWNERKRFRDRIQSKWLSCSLFSTSFCYCWPQRERLKDHDITNRVKLSGHFHIMNPTARGLWTCHQYQLEEGSALEGSEWHIPFVELELYQLCHSLVSLCIDEHGQ